MRRNKVIPAVWALAAAILLGGCGTAGDTAEQYTVTLVAKSTQTEFWLSVFAGAEAAATEYNVKLTITGPETEEDYEAQNRMVADAAAAGSQAIVFSAIDYQNNAAAIDAAAQAGVKIVAIDSSVASEQVSTYIGTDNYAAGRMAAQAALDRVEGQLKVGIVNYDVSSANGQERERGASDLFLDSGRAEVVSVINTLAEAESARRDTAAMLEAHPEGGGGVSAGAGHWVPVHQCGGEAPDPAATALHGGGGTRPPAHLRGPQLLPLGAHLRRLRRRPGLGGDLFGPVGPGRRGGQRRVHGPVPTVCGGPLPQRRAGGGADRLPGRPGRPGPGAAVGETAH